MCSQVATFYTRVSPHDLRRLPKRAQEGATHAIAVAKNRLARHDVDWVPALFHHEDQAFARIFQHNRISSRSSQAPLVTSR
jgi:hypothetical protein